MKKLKDREQAFLVASLVVNHLPHSRFERSELRMLPREVVRLADELLKHVGKRRSAESPLGFEPPEED